MSKLRQKRPNRKPEESVSRKARFFSAAQLARAGLGARLQRVDGSVYDVDVVTGSVRRERAVEQ